MQISVSGKLNDTLDGVILNDPPKVLLEKLKGQLLTVSLDKPKEFRTLSQNRLWWGQIVPSVIEYFKEIGKGTYTKDEVHAYLKIVVLGWKPVTKIINDMEVTAWEETSTKTLSVEEFNDAVLVVTTYFANRGHHIELPEDIL